MRAQTALIKIQLEVRDIDKSVAFYKTFLGQSPIHLDRNSALFQRDNPPCIVLLSKSAHPKINEDVLGVQLHYETALHDMLNWLGAQGIQAEDTPEKNFKIRDPDGNTWTLFN